MRAASHLQILSEGFDITLGVVSGRIRDANREILIPANVRELCKTVIAIHRFSKIALLLKRVRGVQARFMLQALWPTPFSFGRNGPALAALAAQLAGSRFDVVHCFRLNTARAPGLLKSRRVQFSRSVLDLDAYESEMAFRAVGPVSRLTGRQLGVGQWLDAVKWRCLEWLFVPSFDDVYVCSELDRSKLRQRFPKNFWHVVPNIVAEPIKVVPVKSNAAPGSLTFLFVGLLSYPPNADGITFFCTKVLPILRRSAGSSFRTLIVGREPGAIMRLNKLDGVEVIGDAQDISPYYAQADVAIVPLRAGGGTRIKILEAFSQNVPVIATSIGAEGLEVTPNTNILIADNADDFAHQCYRLWKDPLLRRRIGSAGHDLWRTRYNPTALRAALGLVYRTSQAFNSQTSTGFEASDIASAKTVSTGQN
jgi:glycosyltransferase involved in cell wall biosynthesis